MVAILKGKAVVGREERRRSRRWSGRISDADRNSALKKL